ncbi:heptaprenylglyceryl phosphate synthase [Bacillus sp. SD088]|uniref:heptaprenylglyceryl phosphate synthase n=1 Tax=Bacillus sp. SD088 TaxID=2782012 RepID=UPI001A979FF3|nr:heptaprenylglyceryl phosphate synthase [Bacillus sp. SD088]MBO0992494.1 heptaprenylglyceryl phosphate synthase [Bacillus sp. SD088]
MCDVKEWRHAFKLDPAKSISDKDLEKICESGTDAIIVGGTDHVTLENVLQLMSRIRRYTVPCVLEVSNLESLTPGFDLYFIPSVLNTAEIQWFSGLHHKAVKEYGEIMDWDEVLVEGYCILNSDCKVAELTKAATSLDDDDVIAYARMAEKMFQMPIFYMEYSGDYGDPALVEKVSDQLSNTILFYGGGIQTVQQAKEMKQFADCIIVGNIVYENVKEALKTVHVLP